MVWQLRAWPNAFMLLILAAIMPIPFGGAALGKPAVTQGQPASSPPKPITSSPDDKASSKQIEAPASQARPKQSLTNSGALDANLPSASGEAKADDVDGKPDGNEYADADADVDDKGHFTNLIDEAFIILSLLIVLTFALVTGLRMRRRRKSNASKDNKGLGMGYDNQSSPRRSLAQGDPRDALISDLNRKIQVIEQRLTALENGGSLRGARAAVAEPQPRPRSDFSPNQQDSYYDRKRQPQDLPEDNGSPNQRAPAHDQTSTPPRSSQPSTGSVQQFADDLAELFNRANKPDFDALVSRYGAESYTNDRRGDLAQLIKDVNDRFWVVPVPGRPEIALMIPGFTVKKSWAKLRQPETDHPLAHHFEVRRGDRLQVIRPAFLRRNSNNFWELEQKGEVVGIS